MLVHVKREKKKRSKRRKKKKKEKAIAREEQVVIEEVTNDDGTNGQNEPQTEADPLNIQEEVHQIMRGMYSDTSNNIVVGLNYTIPEAVNRLIQSDDLLYRLKVCVTRKK